MRVEARCKIQDHNDRGGGGSSCNDNDNNECGIEITNARMQRCRVVAVGNELNHGKAQNACTVSKHRVTTTIRKREHWALQHHSCTAQHTANSGTRHR